MHVFVVDVGSVHMAGIEMQIVCDLIYKGESRRAN
jgi:hypothetical protein